ncbi:glycoside hydrolase [Thozetella sp. PMI_491]|nr:glycoside hydrolase [Thozetella sp. PMI_491]
MTCPLNILSEHAIGDTTARFLTDDDGRVGLWLYPTALAGQLASRRATVANESWVRNKTGARAAIKVEPLVHIRISGDDQAPQFGPGRTLMWSPSIDRFRLVSQQCDPTSVLTVLGDNTGLRIEHRLQVGYQEKTCRSEATFINGSDRPVQLELLTSFSISGITPFAVDDAPGRLVVHRFRSVWSAEGRLVTDSVEHLHLERCWAGNMYFAERFGQVGSMPVRGWFPTALVEDAEAGVVWGARLACPASWQLELGRRYDDLVLSGGIADREFGHWTKTIKPGESFRTPPAWLTCVAGSLDVACERLVSVDIPAAEAKPEIEHDLPVVYNDWCTSWGAPTHDQILKVADKIAPLGVLYLVIDAGWYMPVGKDAHWATTFGDWKANRERFPDGLQATARAIRERGLIPGIWVEPEHVAKDSVAFGDVDHLVKRDGQPLTIGIRRAWDLHDPYATNYIDERIIKMIEQSGFGYAKFDYSETLGIGVDHPDGLGEGLRRQIEGTHAMFDRITAALPKLVIETVSAGGHRLEASFLQRSSQASFSDAHEIVEIPIIAAALHRLMLPRQSQIWAVLHHDDTPQRMDYTLAATFLGRMCLSGDILELDEHQVARVHTAIKLYARAAPVIKDGKSRLAGDAGASWRHPTGWQALIRVGATHGLVVIHTFDKSPGALRIELPTGGTWRVVETFTDLPVVLSQNELRVNKCSNFSSQIVLLKQ